MTAVTFYPTDRGEIAQVSFGVASVMPMIAAERLAATLERLIVQTGREAQDARSANPSWADNIQVGADLYAARLASLSAAMAAAKAPAVVWVKPLHTAAPGLFRRAV